LLDYGKPGLSVFLAQSDKFLLSGTRKRFEASKRYSIELLEEEIGKLGRRREVRKSDRRRNLRVELPFLKKSKSSLEKSRAAFWCIPEGVSEQGQLINACREDHASLLQNSRSFTD
jgi:hypothetical protein